MHALSNRLVQAQQAANPVKHVDTQQRIAGKKGEERVLEILAKNGGIDPSDMFRALRVPDEFQTRRHEIDLIVVTGYGLYCIEVKNWGGKLRACADPMYWEQCNNFSEARSQQIQHLNPVAETKKKATILRNHLMRGGICLSESKFIPRVILINETCDVDDGITSDYCVITFNRIMEFASSFTRTLTSILTDPFIPYFFRGQLSYTQMSQTRAALHQIGTWDVLNLNGGRQLIGDYKGCTELSLNRKDIEEISFCHQRNATMASIRAVLGQIPQVTVRLYKRGGEGWFTRTIAATATIRYDLDIAFRIAGESADAKIPANDIDNIMLSR